MICRVNEEEGTSSIIDFPFLLANMLIIISNFLILLLRPIGILCFSFFLLGRNAATTAGAFLFHLVHWNTTTTARTFLFRHFYHLLFVYVFAQ